MGTMDELLNESAVASLTTRLRAVRGAGSTTALDRLATSAVLNGRNLRSRVDLIRDALLEDLPAGFDSTAALVRDLVRDSRFRGWTVWPVSEVVVSRALSTDSVESFDDAMAILAELTGRLTCEFAIRGMIRARFDRAISIAQEWTSHDDEHVRRLSSEGTRSHLPWATGVPALLAKPHATRPIVDALYTDQSDYVRRSVANHVNDLSRKSHGLATQIATGWASAPDDNTSWMIRHSMRTLVKSGNRDALALLGYGGTDVHVTALDLEEPRVVLGGALRFSAEIHNAGAEPATVVIDYVVHFLKANGQLAPKVFKLGSRALRPGERATVTKAHSIRPITTRVYYPGAHAVELQVNGVRHGLVSFELEM